VNLSGYRLFGSSVMKVRPVRNNCILPSESTLERTKKQNISSAKHGFSAASQVHAFPGLKIETSTPRTKTCPQGPQT
jgi:hypothetical protein